MTPVDLLLLVVLAILWGGSYFFIRVAVPAFGPAALVMARVVIGGVLLWGFARALRKPIAVREHLPRLAVLGLLNAALPYLLISVAELRLTASFAAILGATVPLFAAAFGARLLGERLSAGRVGGLVLGIVGVAIMVGWGPMALDLTGVLSVLAMLVASASYASAGIYTKLRLKGVSTYSLAFGQQVGALPWLLVPGIVLTPRTAPPAVAWGSLLALGALSTGVAYLLFFKLLERVGPTKTTTVTYLIPFVGMLAGSLVLGEPLTGGMLMGLVLVLCSVVLVNEVRVGRLWPVRAPSRSGS
ncbi:MAG TPA: DMT family transporter [Gemmatimonadaceae bacterium]|nr:DMT family transporter [Gemmatimonadaceae bacterium]